MHFAVLSSICFAGRGAPLNGAPCFCWLVPTQICAVPQRVWQSVGPAVPSLGSARQSVPQDGPALADRDGKSLFAGLAGHVLVFLLFCMALAICLKRSAICQAGALFFFTGGHPR